LAEAASRAGRIALVTGPPGIGKTQLLSEITERARTAGWVALIGRASESMGMPPYLPFTEALATHLRTVPDDRLSAELGSGAAQLARMIPDIVRRAPELPPTPSLDPASDRYRLFEAVSEYLAALAGGSACPGLLLVLEDLHWADQSTLLLLEHLGRRLSGTSIAVMASYRDTELRPESPLARMIEQLTRLGIAERCPVPPLDQAMVGTLLASLAGEHPPPRLAEAICKDRGQPSLREGGVCVPRD
jgi:predicted ATPase